MPKHIRTVTPLYKFAICFGNTGTSSHWRNKTDFHCRTSRALMAKRSIRARERVGERCGSMRNAWSRKSLWCWPVGGRAGQGGDLRMQQQGIAGIAGHHHAWPTTCLAAFPLQVLNAGGRLPAGRRGQEGAKWMTRPLSQTHVTASGSAGLLPSPLEAGPSSAVCNRPLRWVVVVL